MRFQTTDIGQYKFQITKKKWKFPSFCVPTLYKSDAKGTQTDAEPIILRYEVRAELQMRSHNLTWMGSEHGIDKVNVPPADMANYSKNVKGFLT